METTQVPPPVPDAPLPVGVTVLGWLMLAFGALGLLCSPVSIAMPFINERLGSTQSEILRTYTLITSLLALPFAAWELAAGIGLVRGRAWSRRAAMTWAVATVALALVSTPISLVLLSRDPAISGAPGFARSMGLSAGAAGAFMSLLLPAAVLVVLTRPAHVAWFAGRRGR